MTESPKREVIVVLGMDRAGTSLCAQILHLLGMELDDNTLLPDEHNPKGYFEEQPIHQANEELLGVLGSFWDEIEVLRPLPDAWWRRPAARAVEERLTTLVRERLERFSGIWGFKDPRTVRLLPLWRRVFRNCRVRPVYVLAVRHPVAVADSLARRDGMSESAAELLWLERYYQACRTGGAEIRCVVHYEDWFSRPLEQALRLAESTGLHRRVATTELEETLRSAIDVSLLHHDGQRGQVANEAVRALYSLLRERNNAAAPEIPEKLDFAIRLSRTFAQVAGELLGQPLIGAAGAQNRRVELANRVPASGMNMRLYWRPSNDWFSEERSSHVFHNLTDDISAVRLRIAPEATIHELRLDFSDRPGVLRVFGVSLFDTEGELLHRLTPRQLAAKGHSEGMEFIELDGGASVLAIVHSETSVILPFAQDSSQTTKTAASLEIRVCGANPFAELRLLARRVRDIRNHADNTQQALQRSEAARSAAQGLLSERDRELERSAEALASAGSLLKGREEELRRYDEALGVAQRLAKDREEELRRYDEALGAAQRVVKDQEEELHRHAEDLALAQRLADEQAQQILGHKATIEFQMARISELEAVLHETSARVDSLGNDLKQAEAQREELKAQLGAILDSLTWRLAYPIRWLGAFARRRRRDAVQGDAGASHGDG
jgi:hypothetical protein